MPSVTPLTVGDTIIGFSIWKWNYTHAAPNSLHFGPVASTRMACPPEMMAQEAALVTAFGRATRYRIAGESLDLLEGDTVLARFESRYFK